MLDYIITCLKRCPLLEGVLLTADFLGSDGECLGVFALASEPVIASYADGGRLKQFVFHLAHRSGGHRENSEKETAFYESLGAWLEQATNLPGLGGERVPQYFEVLKTGVLEKRNFGSDRYGMECRLIYYSEKGSER